MKALKWATAVLSLLLASQVKASATCIPGQLGTLCGNNVQFNLFFSPPVTTAMYVLANGTRLTDSSSYVNELVDNDNEFNIRLRNDGVISSAFYGWVDVAWDNPGNTVGFYLFQNRDVSVAPALTFSIGDLVWNGAPQRILNVVPKTELGISSYGISFTNNSLMISIPELTFGQVGDRRAVKFEILSELSVPEPRNWLLLLSALLFGGVWLRRIRHRVEVW